MELLKWFGAGILAVAAIALAGGIISTILAISAIMSGAAIVGFLIFAVAAFIRQFFSSQDDTDTM